jgi:hypothetical protein
MTDSPSIDLRPLGERVATLEADMHSSQDDVREIFVLLHQAAATMAELAKGQAITQQQIDNLAQRFGAQHTPPSCPNTPVVRQLQQTYWSARGALALIAGGAGVVGTLVGAGLSYLLRK